MDFEINKVAVLGTGVMGSQIAAHLSNANIQVYAYDISQEVANQGLEVCKNLKPSPFYNVKTIELITAMNYELAIIQDRLLRRWFKNDFKETFIETEYKNTINNLKWRLEKHLTALVIKKFIK